MPEDTTTYSEVWADDPRTPVPPTGDERLLLTAMLDWQRRTFELKCTGLSAAQLSERAVPPSTLSLHGLVRHLAGNERWWFRQQFRGEDVGHLYYTDDDPDADFDRLDGDPEESFAAWRAECARSEEIAAASDLDDTGTRRATGEPVSLRGILLKMIAEYARHNGHADLLRERLDGRTGH
jgi:hypothetical protein